ncbi:putative ATP-dependent RNA helicase DHX57 [Saccopteryx bilineata]|uniref:putative ATP-dependent RNA helicase DHX57 n=1 Tax=Saccopteryx bilineata TaxID=59482 RepID=UPI00338DAB17
MVGKNRGLVALLCEHEKRPILSFHCILHQEALCAQMCAEQLGEVMSLVIRVVNFIVARALNNCQFKTLLDEFITHPHECAGDSTDLSYTPGISVRDFELKAADLKASDMKRCEPLRLQVCIHVNCLFGNDLFDGPIRASLLSTEEMASLKRQFTELLSDIGFVKEGLRAREIEKRALGGDGILEAAGEEANSNAENPKLISAMLCAALYPNVVQVKSPEGKFQKTSTGAVRMQPKSEELKFVTKNDVYVHIHPSSVNYQVRHFDSPYLLYHEKIKTSRVFIRDCSMVSVYPLVLFGGGQVNVQLQRGEFVVSLDDGWIRFVAASHQVAELVKELRCELDQLLQDKIKNPSMDLCTCPRGSRIISMIVKLVTTQ